MLELPILVAHYHADIKRCNELGSVPWGVHMMQNICIFLPSVTYRLLWSGLPMTKCWRASIVSLLLGISLMSAPTKPSITTWFSSPRSSWQTHWWTQWCLLQLRMLSWHGWMARYIPLLLLWWVANRKERERGWMLCQCWISSLKQRWVCGLFVGSDSLTPYTYKQTHQCRVAVQGKGWVVWKACSIMNYSKATVCIVCGKSSHGKTRWNQLISCFTTSATVLHTSSLKYTHVTRFYMTAMNFSYCWSPYAMQRLDVSTPNQLTKLC